LVYLHVRDLHDGALKDCAAGSGVCVSRSWKLPLECSESVWAQSTGCSIVKKFSVKPQHKCKLSLTKLHCALGDRFEYTFQLEPRPVDNLKQLSCGSLSLMRFAQLSLKPDFDSCATNSAVSVIPSH
jgi:hypothetical protein